MVPSKKPTLDRIFVKFFFLGDSPKNRPDVKKLYMPESNLNFASKSNTMITYLNKVSTSLYIFADILGGDWWWSTGRLTLPLPQADKHTKSAEDLLGFLWRLAFAFCSKIWWVHFSLLSQEKDFDDSWARNRKPFRESRNRFPVLAESIPGLQKRLIQALRQLATMNQQNVRCMINSNTSQCNINT